MQQHEITAKRVAADISQAEVARRIGVSRAYLNQLEGGKHTASEKHLRAIGVVLAKAATIKSMAEAIWASPDENFLG